MPWPIRPDSGLRIARASSCAGKTRPGVDRRWKSTTIATLVHPVCQHLTAAGIGRRSGAASWRPRYRSQIGTARLGKGQDPASVAKNASFFDSNDRYAQSVGSLETYRHIRNAVDKAIIGARRLLDVGNGGVFDYDTSLAEEIVGVDLFLDKPSPTLPEHITLRRGDALALHEPDAAYDVVLEISVFHHLVGSTEHGTLENIRRAVAEAHRVLEPGGRLVVMESCVSARSFAVERRLFGLLRRLAQTPLMRHPATLQFPPATIAEVIREQFGSVVVTAIPVGRWIVQFGVRWPASLTPARPYLFTATCS
jgi:SAM-dependent methyltransferase